MSVANSGGNEYGGASRVVDGASDGAGMGGGVGRRAPGGRSRARGRRGTTLASMAAAAVLAVGLAACGGSSSATRSSTSTSAPATSVTSTSAPASTTTVPSASTTVVHVPVEPCATEAANGRSAVSLPLTVAATVPSTLAGQVSSFAAFSDNQGIMQVIAPRAWTCRALVAGDGSAGMMVVPTGTSIPTDPHQLPAQGIVASETSACVSCTLGQACPLFPAALTALHEYDPSLPCAAPSARVTVTRVSATEVRFAAPAGVPALSTGTGATSGGGPYPVHGVMTWSSARARGAWTSTCTLPASASSVCEASLTAFAAAYPAG